MPRGSSRAADAPKLGFGLQEGIAKFTNCRYANIQHNKADGTAVTPFFGFRTDLVKLDDDLQPVGDDATIDKEFIVAWGSKDGLVGLSNSKFRPGKANGPDDEDPEDLGTEIGTEGNSMWVESANYAPFADSEWMLFTLMLEKKGFKPEINYQSYAPNYDDLVVKVKTVDKADLCKRLGIRSKEQEGGKGQTCWEVVEVLVRPYEQKGAGKSAGKGAAKGAEKPAGATASTGTNGTASPELVELFTRCIQGDGDKIKGVQERNSGKEVEVGKVQSLFMPVLTAFKIPMKDQKPLLEAVKKLEFWEGHGAEAGVMVDAESKKVGF